METISTLNSISRDDLYIAFNEAFADYDRTWTRPEFDTLLQRRGYTPECSFGAFEGERLVAFTLNCIDGWQGMKTAYDTGTGTLKEYRGRGLASRIFSESIPYLKAAGVEQYLLEVLQHNTKAVSVYTKLGFNINRGLNYFLAEMAGLQLNSKELPEQYSLKPIDLSNKDIMKQMWDFTPSWQNSFASILRQPGSFRMIGAYMESDLVGYGITDPSSGDITQLVVAREHRRKGIGSALLKALIAYNQFPSVKILNAEEDYEPMKEFAANNNIPLLGKQFEMTLML